MYAPKEAKHTLKAIGALEWYATYRGYPRVHIMQSETKAFPLSRVCEVSGTLPSVMRKHPHAADAVRIVLACWSKRREK